MTEGNIEKLRRLKKDLLKTAKALKNQLQKQEESEYKAQYLSHIIIPDVEEVAETSNNESDERDQRLCEVMRHVTGIKFEDTDKTWLHDDIYVYKTNLITKAIEFFLELKVRVQDDNIVDTTDIVCHFVNVESCYMLEVAPWIQLLTRIKNFSYFISAISDYSDYSISRSRILSKIEKSNYATLKECLGNRGGILAYVHPAGSKNTYLKFSWAIMFSEQTWHIEHFLTISPTDAGKDFAEKNSDLLSNFCKLGLKQGDLEELWAQLITALAKYKENV